MDYKDELEEAGLCCVYCGTPTESMCCSEVHLEEGYYTADGELILEHELEDYFKREKK